MPRVSGVSVSGLNVGKPQALGAEGDKPASMPPPPDTLGAAPKPTSLPPSAVATPVNPAAESKPPAGESSSSSIWADTEAQSMPLDPTAVGPTDTPKAVAPNPWAGKADKGGGGGITKKSWFWPAVGCGVIVLLLCPITIIWAGYSFVKKGRGTADALEQAVIAEKLRLRSTLALGSIRQECSADPTGQKASVFVHESVRAKLQPELCKISQDSISNLGSPEHSKAELLSATDEAALAENVEIEPEQCVKITYKDALLIGCSVSEQEFRLLDFKNLSGA